MFLEELNQSVQTIKGIGSKFSYLLRKLDINTLKDLLTYYPFRYEDRSNIKPINRLKIGNYETIKAKIIGYDYFKPPKKSSKEILKILVSDDTGTLFLICYNRNYLKNVMKINEEYFIYGKVEFMFGKLQMSSFEYEKVEHKAGIHTGRIVPIYSLTEGLNVQYLRKLIYNVLKSYLHQIDDPLPDSIKTKYKLLDQKLCLAQIHFPTSFKLLEISRKRLAFDKLFFLQLKIALQRKKIRAEKKPQKYIKTELKEIFLKSLQFTLTEAQKRAIQEIEDDFKKEVPMNRLLQGDVGCGKTVVALTGLIIAAENGYQSAIMAPTEILAVQHYNKIKEWVEKLNIKVALLISELKTKEKSKYLAGIKSGEYKIIIGTHALIQSNVEFNNLAFVIIDEQHRFGVVQRMLLKEKGKNPDILVMTATPIPRTLALTVYGALDVSIIDQLPPGRKPVITKWYYENRINEVYEFINERLNQKEKVYIVYPLVEESEKMDLKDAISGYEKIKSIFKEFNVGLLHGKMKQEEKNEVMRKFKESELNILVTTTVIEVGVDIPEASTLIVEHADRFGLAQLHQLRGRIGRSDIQSYFFLITGREISEDAIARMNILLSTSDGFKISEEDLKLRGPGEFLGTRQSGIPDLKPANIFTDIKIISIARKEAFELVEKDFNLSENYKLKYLLKLDEQFSKEFDFVI